MERGVRGWELASASREPDGRRRYNQGMQDDETRPAAPPPLAFLASSRARKFPPPRVGRTLAPHWGALLALALFLIAGLAVLDDYGVTVDEIGNALRSARVWAFLAGNEEAFFDAPSYVRTYGPSFEMALLFAERSLGIEGARSVYLAQHLLIHLSFLTGGLFIYLLALRLFGGRLLALFAMSLFLLHPRLYAHSFFNGKDIAFLVAFIVALYLAHRAFRRDTVAAFALLGVGVGIAVNLRIMGVVPLAAIPALRALDFAFAQGWPERMRVILTTGAFALAATLTAYALLPYQWADPVGRAAEWWTTPSEHLVIRNGWFRSLIERIADFPEYLPVWFSITSPPFALLLGLIGGATILFRAVRAPREALRNTRRRFGLLLAACFALSILAVAAFNPGFYFGWRHMYFLWALFSLLAALGLSGLAAALSARRPSAAVYGVAGAGLAATLASMALIHPNQQAFFNFSVDRATPEYLRTQYVMEYWRHPMRQALEWLSNNTDLLPDKTAPVARNTDAMTRENIAFLPDAARARLAGNLSVALIPNDIRESWARSARALHRVQVYGNTILTVERKDDLRAVYAATRGREPDDVAAYDAYRLDGAVALVMEPCDPAFVEQAVATLRVTPVDRGDLPPWREGKRDEPRFFRLIDYGAFFDGKCVASLPLPDYPIAEFRVVWSPELLERESAREAIAARNGERLLLARATYDVYLADGELVYVQERCDRTEAERSFRVSVFYERSDDSPERRREWGRDHDFKFHRQGALLEDGACVALFPLPDYPIAGIRTGQYADGGTIWEAAFSANPERYEAAYRAAAGKEPIARGAFDLHILDGDLVYVKEPCEPADTEARFFLHLEPERVSDLPEDRREYGFDNLDFRFFLNGAWFDGRCAARVPMPDYLIAGVRTGQFSGEGEIWSAEFDLGR